MYLAQSRLSECYLDIVINMQKKELAKLHKYEDMDANVESIFHANFVIQTMLSLRHCNHQEINQETEKERERRRWRRNEKD